MSFFIEDTPSANALLRHFSELQEKSQGDSDPDEGFWSFMRKLWPNIRSEGRKKILRQFAKFVSYETNEQLDKPIEKNKIKSADQLEPLINHRVKDEN